MGRADRSRRRIFHRPHQQPARKIPALPAARRAAAGHLLLADVQHSGGWSGRDGRLRLRLAAAVPHLLHGGQRALQLALRQHDPGCGRTQSTGGPPDGVRHRRRSGGRRADQSRSGRAGRGRPCAGVRACGDHLRHAGAACDPAVRHRGARARPARGGPAPSLDEADTGRSARQFRLPLCLCDHRDRHVRHDDRQQGCALLPQIQPRGGGQDGAGCWSVSPCR